MLRVKKYILLIILFDKRTGIIIHGIREKRDVSQ